MAKTKGNSITEERYLSRYFAFLGLLALVAFLFFLFISFSQLPKSQAAYANGYTFRKSITVDNTKVSGSANLTNFPMLVSFTDTDLRTTGNGGDVENANGYDIIFGDASASTTYDFEVEKYVASTGELVAWVRVPTLQYSTDTTIYMYYGNSGVSSSQENVSGVWGSEYKGVWHMSEDPSGVAPQILDSTSNNNDGNTFGSMTSGDLVAAKLGFGIDFDGSGDFIEGTSAGTNFPTGASPRTISAWIWTTTISSGDRNILQHGTNSGTSTFHLYVTSTGKVGLGNGWGTGTIGSFADIDNSQWNYVVGIYEGSGTDLLRIYINGSQDNSGVIANTPTTGTGDEWRTGLFVNGGSYFPGTLDELRITSDAKSADWISTEYNNQNSPGTFYSVGTETTSGEEITVSVDSAAPSVTGGTAKLCDGATAGNNAAISGCSNISSVTLQSGSTLDVSYFVQAVDNNGVGDLAATATGALYHSVNASPASSACTGDNNNCYQQASCTKILPAIDSLTAWYRCDYTLQYYSDDSADAATWVGAIAVEDALSNTASDNSYTTEVAKLAAGTFPDVTFGPRALGSSTTVGNNIEVSHQNQGNVLLDYSVALDNTAPENTSAMDCDTGTIPAANIRFDRDQLSTPGDLAFGSLTKILTVDPATIELDIDISQRTNDSAAQGPTNPRVSYGAGGDDQAYSYWGIQVPADGVLGSCTEELLVTAFEGP